MSLDALRKLVAASETAQIVSIDNEFATVDAVLASNAETHGVDAFALSLIKAERQIRKLFTYMIYQSDAFSSSDIAALRNALANRRVYFRDFVLAWDKLYSVPLKDIVGQDYGRLYGVMEEAIQIRNKIFHGQLTTRYLSREELIGFVEQIRCWCRAVAAGSLLEMGYDGFGRNSFRKSDSPLKSQLAGKIRGIEDYKQLLTDMERRPKNEVRIVTGSTQPSLQALSGTAPTNLKHTDLHEALVQKFPEWVS